MAPTSKPWYKKARYLVPIGLLALTWGVGYAADGPAPTTQQNVAPTEQAASVLGSQAPTQVEASSVNTASTATVSAAAALGQTSSAQPTVTSQPAATQPVSQSATSQPAATQPATTQTVQTTSNTSPAVTAPSTPSSGLSNDNYYTNSSGNEVHSPAFAPSVPANASAQCKDGSYSFSQHHSGTCSGHGGVAIWY